MTREERAFRIAAELARDMLQRPMAASEYRFSLGEQGVVLRLQIEPQIPDYRKGMYVSLGPAGEQCSCCGGSGVQPP